MRRLLGITLKTLKWTGLALSTLLLAGTLVLWVRNVWHVESWGVERFSVEPKLAGGRWSGWGINRWRQARVTGGTLWLNWQDRIAPPEQFPEFQYYRQPAAFDAAHEQFKSFFTPPSRPHYGGIDRRWSFAGVGYLHGRATIVPEADRPSSEVFFFAIPMWMLAVVFALWPLGFVATRLLRRRHRPPNLCPRCGYDLRATPDPAGPRLPQCPECGQPIPASAATPSP